MPPSFLAGKTLGHQTCAGGQGLMALGASCSLFARMSAIRPLRLSSSELLEASHDHIAVRRVQLHEKRPPTRLLRGNERGPASPEKIEHILPGYRRILHRSRGQCDR